MTPHSPALNVLQFSRNAGRIIRACRKALGLTQRELASRLDLSQGALSKLEHGNLVPSAPVWISVCELADVSPNSIRHGFIHTPSRGAYGSFQAAREGFALPSRYAEQAGSRVLTLTPFLAFAEAALGPAKLRELLKARRIDPDYFVDLGNSISLALHLDLADALIAAGRLKPRDVDRLARAATQPEAHGTHWGRLAEPGLPAAERIERALELARQYEVNFRYALDDHRRGTLVVAARPESHLRSLGLEPGTELGDFLLRYKAAWFARVAAGFAGPALRHEAAIDGSGRSARWVLKIRTG